MSAAGPLAGIRVIEFAGLGPGPFCAMMLADHGADVIRIDRVGHTLAVPGDPRRDILNRSRKNIGLNLKSVEGLALARRLCAKADCLIEGFRPGVMERLGLGPEELLRENPALVYGRMTGWGQDGPYAHTAGHDINYIALSGALHAIGRAGEKPVPPLNLVGDFGGGGMMLAFGIVSALLSARTTGAGQVIDCAMTEGSALLMSMIYSLHAQGIWSDRRGANMLDGGCHYYDTYETADGRFVAVGAVEPAFYRELIEKLGLADDDAFRDQNDPNAWPYLSSRLADLFRTRSRDEWCTLLEGSDACFAPVLSLAEAAQHPHNLARNAFVHVDGIAQPVASPRYSVTRNTAPRLMETGEEASFAILSDLGLSNEEIAELRDARVVV